MDGRRKLWYGAVLLLVLAVSGWVLWRLRTGDLSLLHFLALALAFRVGLFLLHEMGGHGGHGP